MIFNRDAHTPRPRGTARTGLLRLAAALILASGGTAAADTIPIPQASVFDTSPVAAVTGIAEREPAAPDSVDDFTAWVDANPDVPLFVRGHVSPEDPAGGATSHRDDAGIDISGRGPAAADSARPATIGADTVSEVDPIRLSVVGAATVAVVTTVHLYQQQAWWQGERDVFRFQNDWSYALNLDKFGHAFGAYLGSGMFRGALSWAGMDTRRSTFYGSLLGLAYELYVETEDGFHTTYGFSPGDALADILGAMVPLAQYQFPILRSFKPKWSYIPSRDYLDALKAGESRAFIDDYLGQSYWIGIDPHPFLPESVASVIPPWMGIGIGASSRDLDGDGGGHRNFYLALDWNFSRISTSSPVLRTIFEAIDFFHIPSPGIAFKEGKISFGIF